MKKQAADEKIRITSLALPETLWKRVHIEAMDQNCHFKEIVRRALVAYFSSKSKGKK